MTQAASLSMKTGRTNESSMVSEQQWIIKRLFLSLLSVLSFFGCTIRCMQVFCSPGTCPHFFSPYEPLLFSLLIHTLTTFWAVLSSEAVLGPHTGLRWYKYHKDLAFRYYARHDTCVHFLPSFRSRTESCRGLRSCLQLLIVGQIERLEKQTDTHPIRMDR